LAATLLAAAPADGNDSTAAPRDGQPPGFGGPGPGWG
jgi:hypothetical protein